jgi:hypothetical protein
LIVADKEKQHWPRDWKRDPLPDPPLTKEQLRKLVVWMEALCAWGAHARNDLIRLEEAVGISAGDPGDPPPPPWMTNSG